MALADTATLARDSQFQDRVTAAAVAAAYQIKGETPDTAHPTRTTKRANLATSIINNPGVDTPRIAWAVASNPTVSNAGTDTTDSDIEYVLTTVWDDLAGVDYTDTI